MHNDNDDDDDTSRPRCLPPNYRETQEQDPPQHDNQYIPNQSLPEVGPVHSPPLPLHRQRSCEELANSHSQRMRDKMNLQSEKRVEKHEKNQHKQEERKKKQQDQEKKRGEVAWELLITERTYVSHLQTLVEVNPT